MSISLLRATSKICCTYSLVAFGGSFEGIVEVGCIIEGFVEEDAIVDSDGTAVGDFIIGEYGFAVNQIEAFNSNYLAEWAVVDFIGMKRYHFKACRMFVQYEKVLQKCT